MLKAYITFLPVWSASLLITRITASTRSSNGECGGLAISSSSLTKSMPASPSVRTSSRRLLGRQADARLDDGADDRSIVDAGELARASDAELRAGVTSRRTLAAARGRAISSRRVRRSS